MIDPYLPELSPWQALDKIPTALYVHLPWCIEKCPYCDFNSHATHGQDFPESVYVAALVDELKRQALLCQDRCIVAVFFGGGTPSLFAPESIAMILTTMHAHFDTWPGLEITLEANPGTTDQAHFVGYRQAGVNRLSLGIQSFHPKHLRALGRIHDGDQALQAIADAKHAGFTRINLDIMFGLPQQTCEEALQDLATAMAQTSGHVSWYELTLEPHTAFAHRPPPLPSHDAVADITEQGHEMLRQNGFDHYEISAFAQTQQVCQHNLHVWQFGDYLGIGAGAHSKLTDATGVHRQYRHYHPKQYLAADDKIASTYRIARHELPFEYLMNRLRVHRPISIDHMQYYATPCLDFFKQATHHGWMTPYHHGDWQTTDLGRKMHNDLLMLCMPAEV